MSARTSSAESGRSDPVVWYIDAGQKYLEPAMRDVEGLLSTKAMPWFDRFADDDFALRVLLNANEEMGVLWGFGNNPSPLRHYFIGYVALAAQKIEMADRYLRLAVASGRFESIESRLLRDIERTTSSS
jgi:hypothetical protein